MKTKRSTREEKTLKKYKASLDLVKSKKTIQDYLSKYDYTLEFIAKGQTLLYETNKAVEQMEIEYNKRYEAYRVFKSMSDALSLTYNLHRKIAKVIFRKDDNSLNKLALNGYKPKAYEEWMECIIKFYEVATSDSEIQSKLAMLTLTPEKMESAKNLIWSVEAAREHYINQKVKAQDSKKIKDKALEKISDWMKIFYAIAKLVIEDQTLLQKTLGKTV